MMDVESRLGRLRMTAQDMPSDSVVADDLRNATRARATRNRRRAQIAAGTCGVAAVLAVAVNTAVGSHSSTPATTAHAKESRQGLSLVSYTGDQEPGFVVKKVPDGFVLQGSSGTVLDVARADDTSPLEAFDHKLVVTVTTPAEAGHPDGTPVTINGSPGTIRTADDGTRTLSYADGSRVVVVQAWGDIDLDRDELVAFAEGITVTDAAQLVRG
jgi:hypothetical protein